MQDCSTFFQEINDPKLKSTHSQAFLSRTFLLFSLIFFLFSSQLQNEPPFSFSLSSLCSLILNLPHFSLPKARQDPYHFHFPIKISHNPMKNTLNPRNSSPIIPAQTHHTRPAPTIPPINQPGLCRIVSDESGKKKTQSYFSLQE